MQSAKRDCIGRQKDFSVMGVRVGILFLGQSIGIDEKNTFH